MPRRQAEKAPGLCDVPSTRAISGLFYSHALRPPPSEQMLRKQATTLPRFNRRGKLVIPLLYTILFLDRLCLREGPNMTTITLKHLAREFDQDPYTLRSLLRKHQGPAIGRRWKWEEPSAALNEVRAFLTKRYGSITRAAGSTPSKHSSPPSPMKTFSATARRT